MGRHRLGAEFVRAVAHKYTVEVGATVVDGDAVVAVTYPEPLEHPWPRSFRYSTEVFAKSRDAAEVQAETAELTHGAEHVLHVHDEAGRLRELTTRGYAHAWTNVIMSAPLENAADTWPERTRPVRSADDVAAANSIEPDNLCHVNALADPYLSDVIGYSDGRIAAKAQVVTLPGETAYVSDMFTAPWARGRGLGTELLSCLHTIARRSGATESLLVPSLETRRDLFYAKRGYEEAAPLALLILDR